MNRYRVPRGESFSSATMGSGVGPRPALCAEGGRNGGLTRWARCGNLPNGCLTADAEARDVGARSQGEVRSGRSPARVPVGRARADVRRSNNRGKQRAGFTSVTGTAVACYPLLVSHFDR